MPVKLAYSGHKPVSVFLLVTLLLVGCEKQAVKFVENERRAEEIQVNQLPNDLHPATRIERTDDEVTAVQLEPHEQSMPAPVPVVSSTSEMVTPSEAERLDDNPKKIELVEKENFEHDEPECFVEEVYISADGQVTAFEQLSAEPISVHHESFELPTPILARQERFIQISRSNVQAGTLWIDIIDVERTVPSGCLVIIPKSFILGCEASQAGVRGSSSCQN